MPDIAGLKLIVPTSVAGSGVSVSATGKVTFTSSATINVNGCFTSAYDNYLMVMRFTSGATTGVKLRMRASGTDNSTANSYVSQYLDASSTSVTGARFTQNITIDISASYATQSCGTHLYFYGPFLTQPTAMRSVNVNDSSSAYLYDIAATHNQSTAYDGFTLTSGSITGALTIYGLAQ